MKALGVTGGEIDIRPAARQMLQDIGHAASTGEAHYDVTFENVQAGLRTDYLFRLANHNGGLVVGTGDLSELGLGWCTYGVGDQMSHYNPNASVAKTLIQHLIRFVAATGDLGPETAPILHDILATEISPELVPPGADGAIQSTESVVGPYALQDFNLFYTTRYGFRPSKIAYLSWNAWHDARARGVAGQHARRRAARLQPSRDQALAAGVSAALFPAVAVQALGAAQRPEDFVGRLAVAARRLARALGRETRRSGSPNSTRPFPTRFEGPLGGSRARIAQPKRSRGQFLINSYKM